MIDIFLTTTFKADRNVQCEKCGRWLAKAIAHQPTRFDDEVSYTGRCKKHGEVRGL